MDLLERGLEVCQIVLLILIQNKLFPILVLVYCSCFEHFFIVDVIPTPSAFLLLTMYIPISSF